MPGALPAVDGLHFYSGDPTSANSGLEKLAKEAEAAGPCTALLNAGDYQILTLDAPNVPKEELKAAIRWRLKDMLEFHVDDAAIDVLDIPGDKDAPTRAHSMFAVAAKNQLIAARQEQFEKNKLMLDVIDIPEMAQRNIAALFEAEGRGLAMLYFDNAGGLLTVSHGGELHLSRRMDVSLAQLQNASESERTDYFERVTVEVQRSLDHFDRHSRHISLSKLLLAPNGTGNGALQAYLAANLYLAVETLRLEDVLDISGSPELISEDGQQCFFLTIGAALRREEMAL
ncbi:MAG: agglutinin biosis protein MshI [Herminiimonas sp.]|nr:agglutinin biosis protein MshI [Herminiimonas sp.]